MIYFYDLLPCSTGSKTRSRSYRVHCVRRCADCFRRDEDRCGRHRKRQPQCAGQLPHRVVARHHSRPYPDGHRRRAGPGVRGAQFGAGRGGRVPHSQGARRIHTTADSAPPLRWHSAACRVRAATRRHQPTTSPAVRHLGVFLSDSSRMRTDTGQSFCPTAVPDRACCNALRVRGRALLRLLAWPLSTAVVDSDSAGLCRW